MSADKVLYLEITKVSQDIIRAWKNPKKLKWTTHNQFKRCAQYYVETSIDTVLPLIKNIEQFSYLEQPKPKKANLVNNGKKTMMDEAREFLGNVELTTRTRGQRRKMYNEDGIAQSTSSICSQVSQTTKRKISLSLEHEVYPVKTNVRRNTHFSPNYPESNNTGYNDLSIPSSMNTDIIGKSVKSMQTSSKTCESRAKHSASKMCTSPLKVYLI